MKQLCPFGLDLVAAYEAEHFTRASFARAIKVGYNTVWRYETGENAPGVAILLRMKAVLGAERFATLGVRDACAGYGAAPIYERDAIVAKLRAAARYEADRADASEGSMQSARLYAAHVLHTLATEIERGE